MRYAEVGKSIQDRPIIKIANGFTITKDCPSWALILRVREFDDYSKTMRCVWGKKV